MLLPQNILELIEKYQKGTATPEEKFLLNEWYHSFNDSEAELGGDTFENEQQLNSSIKSRLFETIHQQNDNKVIVKKRKWQLPAVAAAVVFLFSAADFFMFLPKSENTKIVYSKPPGVQPKNDIAPGGNKALLTLSDGSTVVLDSASTGTISQQGNIKVRKLNNGLIAYTNDQQTPGSNEIIYNTIATPRGGKYHVTLSDGTEVWLNAASSIRFPVVFTGNERKVEITGEAYFEVAKNKVMPFKVTATSSEIEVLGTHFNVNAYNDEPELKATLLEGKIKISAPNFSVNSSPKFLNPGQQAVINKEGKINLINNADVEEAVAWKNGRFQFKSADLKSILRQISRWYDVDIEYKGNVNLHFTGQLNRDENVSKVFEQLVLTGEVHFKIEDKKIIVSP